MSKDKTIVLISGPLGAGKSSLCKQIHNELGYFHVDGDAFFVPLEDTNLSWKERLKQSWDWIVEQTSSHVQNGESVVIDFVVEDELPWFLEQVSKLEAKVKYIVLTADEKDIEKRLNKRDGSLQYFERSRFLLDQLQHDPDNKNHLFDTSGKNTREVMEQVMTDERFDIE